MTLTLTPEQMASVASMLRAQVAPRPATAVIPAWMRDRFGEAMVRREVDYIARRMGFVGVEILWCFEPSRPVPVKRSAARRYCRRR